MSNESNNQKFDNLVTILIASVAIWVAITVYFQNYASNLSDQARRRAQQYSIEATQKDIDGTVQYSYDWQGAFQTWKELSWQITAAQQNGDKKAEERYKKLQDRIVKLSKMLGPDYFDPSVGWPDYAKYESDTYLVESTRLSETYLAESDLGNFTDNVGDSLVVQITLLTVALSLYGLSLALQGRIRWLFVIVGTGIVGMCVLWLGWSLLTLWVRPEVNDQAIQAYAEGIGLEYQSKYDEAIDKFSLAIQQKPDYAKAYYERGLAYYDKGDKATAISEMETARSHGLDDTSLNWNLGWLYYLSGNYAKAIETNERILVDHPEVIGMRENQAISYLSMGDFENSQKQYDLLLAEAQRQVNEARQNGAQPSASLWYYLDAGALDLESLVGSLDNNSKDWMEAPEASLVTGDQAAIRDFAYAQMKRLKEATVALEYTGSLPATQQAMQIETFTIGQVTERDNQGFVTGFKPAPNNVIPFGEKSFSVEFTYSGPAPKQMVWKVYVNGYEDQSLRVVTNADISSGGTWYYTFGYQYTDTFILSKGEYVVELYADNILVQRSTFHVQ